jgi:hypothetical protein
MHKKKETTAKHKDTSKGGNVYCNSGVGGGGDSSIFNSYTTQRPMLI